jgi:excisionase family DNA binding protein
MLPEADVVRLVEEQGLPARRLGSEWRFFKPAVQRWLSNVPPEGSGKGIWAAAGTWKDDPYSEELLKEIHRGRGRPRTEAEG